MAAPRSLIAVAAWWGRQLGNGSASAVIVRPFAVMAARVLGPGPLRLKMVRLAHNMGPVALASESDFGGEDGESVQPTQRAA